MAASKSAVKHWTRIIQRWPVDKVRPENVSFQKLMQQRLDKSTSPASAQNIASGVKSTEAPANPIAPAKWDEQRELRQVNALYSLLENRYSKESPMPQSLRYPASQPTYYDDLVKELHEAPDRSWFGGVVKRIKGSLRFS